MKRKMLKAVLLLSLVAGCVGCGNKDVAQVHEGDYPTIDFLCDDAETKIGSMDEAVTEVVDKGVVGTVVKVNDDSDVEVETKVNNDSDVETETKVNNDRVVEAETKGGTVNVADAGQKETVKQNATQDAMQNETVIEEEFTISPEMESAWKEYMEALKEAEKYAMKYEVSEAGIGDIATFVKTEVIDSDKETYPNARAWKNKACNIAFIDDTTEGVTFTVDTKIGTDRAGSQAYIMTLKFSNGAEQEIEYSGTGVVLVYLSDSAKLAYGKGTAKNLDNYVK